MDEQEVKMTGYVGALLETFGGGKVAHAMPGFFLMVEVPQFLPGTLFRITVEKMSE